MLKRIALRVIVEVKLPSKRVEPKSCCFFCRVVPSGKDSSGEAGITIVVKVNCFDRSICLGDPDCCACGHVLVSLFQVFNPLFILFSQRTQGLVTVPCDLCCNSTAVSGELCTPLGKCQIIVCSCSGIKVAFYAVVPQQNSVPADTRGFRARKKPVE